MTENKKEIFDHASNVRRKNKLKLPLAIFVLASVARAADAVMDLFEGSSLLHVGLEMGMAFVAASGAWLLFHELRVERDLRASSENALEEITAHASEWKASAENWRKEYESTLKGLGVAIDAQFADWKLSPAEAEVCLLLLKGLSFKEVGTVRDSSERTVRQQANAAYKKAGLAGRAELSAYFLEDLLLPVE